MKHFITEKGTELPLLSLKGKDYLEVKYRIVWFREEKPDWSIETELISVTDVSAYAKATIRDAEGHIKATSHKFENKLGFADFIEKSETGAIGRALALIGYGTQFCADELDEGKRIVDSPVDRGTAAAAASTAAQALGLDDTPDLSSYVIKFGKHKDKKLSEVSTKDLHSYAQWISNSAAEKGQPLSAAATEFVERVRAYLSQREGV